jgi:hypothetical protein
MGTWGTGLYSGDFAADLRSTIGAVSRLPFDTDRLVEILCETVATAANDPDDSDHTVFWLVLADQFAKRGLNCDRVRDAALAIIDTDQDIAVHAALGMTPSDLSKRRKALAELRARLVNQPKTTKPRKTLTKPQPLLMEIGDLIVFPTCQGEGINPYFGESEFKQTGWNQDGWGALLIIDCGRAFDFLAWYRFLTILNSIPQKPDVSCLQGPVDWELELPGTCSAAHYKKMQLEKLCNMAIDRGRVRECFGAPAFGTAAAVNDISIANGLCLGPKRPAGPRMRIRSLTEIAPAP